MYYRDNGCTINFYSEIFIKKPAPEKFPPPDSHRFMQNNDSKYTSQGYALTWLYRILI